MTTRRLHNEDILGLLGLTSGELARLGGRPRDLRRLFRLLSPRDRSLLRLVRGAGVSRRDLAGLLGVCPRTVRRRLQRTRARLLDPLNLALAARWKRLDPAAQRLLHLHRLHGMSLTRLARLGLVPAPAGRRRPGGVATVGDLRALMRRLERRARRAAHRRQRRQGADSAAAEAPSSSNG